MAKKLFLTSKSLPKYSVLTPQSLDSLLKESIQETKIFIEKVCKLKEPLNWHNTVGPISNLTEILTRTWGATNHLAAVSDCDEIRKVINDNNTKVTDFWTDFFQNEKLFNIYFNLKRSISKKRDPVQHKVISDYITEFKLAGAHLSPKDKRAYKENNKKLSQLTQKFSENILDSTKASSLKIQANAVNIDKNLEGIPSYVIETAKKEALEQKFDGLIFSLLPPSYFPFIQYAGDRSQRFKMFSMYSRRCSDLSDEGDSYDNGPIIGKILKYRYLQSKLLGFSSPAEMSLSTKMADSPEAVISFLKDLAKKAKPFAEQELKSLKKFAVKNGFSGKVESWDIPFLSEKLKMELYSFDNEELRKFFPLNKVINGLFETVKSLFSCDIYDETEKYKDFIWENSVRVYRITEQKETIGFFFLDLFARKEKRGGAWMDESRCRRKIENHIQTPVALLNCNFNSPINRDESAYITHDEVVTLFHEFGHGLHHLLTKVNHIEVSGINGVEWDAVELPSQFLENFAWEFDTLSKISEHKETKKSIDREFYERIIQSKNFNSGLQMLRQIEFSLFDILIHKDLKNDTLEDETQVYREVLEILKKVRKEISVTDQQSFVLFPNTFSHIFDGGYASGYYSYKWAEVLSSDCYGEFEMKNKNERKLLGQKFRLEVLEKGGSRDALVSFRSFMKRDPKPDAMMRHLGLT